MINMGKNNLKKRLYIISFLIFCVLLIPSMSQGKVILIDGSSPDWVGNTEKKIKIGELKHNYNIILEIQNNHDLCNISCSMVELSEWGSDWGTLYLEGIGNSSTGIINPGEDISIEYTYNGLSSTLLGLKFVVYFNDSAYTSLQEKVEIIYKVQVYSDDGSLIIDTENTNLDDQIDDQIDEQPENETCCGSILILSFFPFGILLITIKIKNRDTHN